MGAAVVTGAGGALCAMFSRALAQSGAKVAVLDLNEEAAQKVADEITANEALPRLTNATSSTRTPWRPAIRRFSRTLVRATSCSTARGGNNPRATTDKEYYEAGDLDAETKSFFDLEQKGVEVVFNLNFLGTLIPTQTFAKDMLGREGCCILNISSMNAYTPLTKIPAYSGAKAAISNFTQWLAVHFSKMGIRVNAIAPGFFSTKQNAALLWNADGTPTARTGKILAATPMGRFGEAEELVGAVLLFPLNNNAASFITGVVPPIDGGFSAYSGV